MSDASGTGLLGFCPEGTTHVLVEKRPHRGQTCFAVVAVVPDGASVPLNGYYDAFLAHKTKAALNVALAGVTVPEPCGYCRRCAVHDDPGGCLEVEAWARENDPEGRFEVFPPDDDQLAGLPDGNGERW